MAYYISKTVAEKDFEKVIEQVTAELKNEGFGVLTVIDFKATLKSKIDADFKKYTVLGACNPKLALKALQAEDKIGVFLPCNIVVEENENGEIEISTLNVVEAMAVIDNKTIETMSGEIQQKLIRVFDNMK